MGPRENGHLIRPIKLLEGDIFEGCPVCQPRRFPTETGRPTASCILVHPSILRLLPSPTVLESIPVKIIETYHDSFQSSSMDSDLDWSDFDWSGFDWSDFNSRYLGLTFDGTSFFSYKSHHLLISDEIHQPLPRHKAHRFPVEIFSEIFLYTVQADSRSRTELMLVCRYWYDTMLSTPGIHSHLRIYWWTKKKDVEMFGKRWLLDVTVDLDYVPADLRWVDPNIDPVEFQACFMATAEAASRWRSLSLLSLPPPEECKDLQIVHPLQNLESFKLAPKCNLGNFLEPLLNAITTTVTPRFTIMEVFHPGAALYLLQPVHFQIFESLTTLRLICRRMQNPVDVLPCLHKLEVFEAHYLFLPIYPLGVDLPLTQTLRVLSLKSVSVQWMAGQMFPALEECCIVFPHHADAIQSVDMPSCSILKYDSNNLGALEHFYISNLDKLEIKCGQWRTWRGNLQLIALHPIFAAQSLICLHMEIKCSERLLTYMLSLAPALEELWMRLSSPHALSSAFFLALAAGGRKSNAGSSSQAIVPLGRTLRKLDLHYKRWLRGPERNGLIPAFGAVVASHPLEDQIFSFRLSIGEGSELQEWNILEPVERFNFASKSNRARIFIGVSSPYGIVPLSKIVDNGGDALYGPLTESEYQLLPRESEYITIKVGWYLPIEIFLPFHSLKEMRMNDSILTMKLDTPFSLDAPFFHTLESLHVESISSVFFAGQTFHRLERYWEDRIHEWDIPGQGPLTEMPVCTTLVVPLRRFATLKLPQVRELGLRIDAEHDHIWEKHIVVNANLSGLKLLHLRYSRPTWPTIVIIKILESLPALETLITGTDCLIAPYIDFFQAFVPMNVLGSSGLNQSSWKGQISGVLCPRLESLQIEGINLTERAGLMPVLKDIVTLRAIIEFPLKSFTFYSESNLEAPRMWQLIGRDKSFVMEEVVPTERFQLDI